MLIDFRLTAVSSFSSELMETKAIRIPGGRLPDCPARDPFYLMVGPNANDRILAAITGNNPGPGNRIAKHDLVGLNVHLLRRHRGSSKWELVLTTGAVVPIHDARREDVNPGEDYRSMRYIILRRTRARLRRQVGTFPTGIARPIRPRHNATRRVWHGSGRRKSPSKTISST